MEYTRENLKKLSLVEIKQICKDYYLPHIGTKTTLINNILNFIKKGDKVIISLPTNYKPPTGKKVIGIIMGDHEKRIQLGKLMEKNKVKILYYSIGVHYYQVDKDFEFTKLND
jgi:hypothetical protein